MKYDGLFLKQLQSKNNRVIYGKITALSQDERPLESIEGRITGGSLNIDGKSALRRTCSFSMVSSSVNINNYYWSFQNKFKLEIGLENDINSIYPEIIWFPQGIFIITSFSNAIATSSNTINISGKDKMCLLNGEVGGTFNSQIDFGKLEQYNKDGTISLIKLPLKKIIREMVHQYGGEPFYNIIINDLDDSGLELQEYRLDVPLYIAREVGDDEFSFPTLDPKTKISYIDSTSKNKVETTIDKIPEYEKLMPQDNDDPTEVYINDGKTLYTVAKIEFGDAAGFKEVPLIYDGDLIANPGESITSILDKIKTMLIHYEYFYNLEGQFIFQKKREDLKIIDLFQGNRLITSFNNNPRLNEVKNDYTVWGKRKTLSGAELPIHGRYAIQKKPISYTSITVTDEELKDYNKAYDLNVKGQQGVEYTIDKYDWRELIYQMSLDYHKYNHLDDYELKIIKANPEIYPTGRTGYEQYYIDMEGFWRQLYNPNSEAEIKEEEKKKAQCEDELKKLEQEKLNDMDPEKGIPPGKNQNYYDRKIYEKKEEIRKINNKIVELQNFYTEEGNRQYWNKDYYNSPESLNFYFDFLDTDGATCQFSVDAIGDRPKVSNNDKIKAILYREIPYIIFGKPLDDNPKTGYRYFNIEGFENAFQMSYQGKSVLDEIEQLVTNYSDCIESISISAIPCYDLEPNTIFIIDDPVSGINGEYIIDKYSISLNYNSTMNITAQKKIKDIYY